MLDFERELRKKISMAVEFPLFFLLSLFFNVHNIFLAWVLCFVLFVLAVVVSWFFVEERRFHTKFFYAKSAQINI